MIKRIALSALVVVCLVMATVIPCPVRAETGLTVSENWAWMDFPASLTFKISAHSDIDISDIRLHYRVEQMAFARVISEVYIPFTPAPSVIGQWVWDMRKTGGLPPGSSVDYWWTLTDDGGRRVTTEPATVSIEDERYEWRRLTEGEVTLYWYHGDDAFAAELMSVTRQALTRLQEETGARLQRPVKMYIYAGSGDLRGSMIFPQEWTGGVAFSSHGIIAIGIGPNDLDWGSRAIAHELTHLVIHQVTMSPYGGLPTWLDEGLAVNSEGELSKEFAGILSVAVRGNSLISVRSLASPFSAYSDEAVLAYAQSGSIVKFLIETYGQDKMFRLLNTFAQGSTYDEALEKAYGFDMEGLDTRWRASLSGT